MTAPLVFLKEVRDELSKVKWPTKEEVIRLTAVVIIVSFMVGIFTGGVDLLLTKVLEVLIK